MFHLQKKLVLVLGFLIGFCPLYGQEKQAFNLLVTNIQSDRGAIMIAIYNSSKTFLGEQVVTGWAEKVTKKGRQLISIKDLAVGHYAISIFHDENANGKLDSNVFRIPKEPFGFSNNPKKRVGPPSFEQAKFRVPLATKQISIALN